MYYAAIDIGASSGRVMLSNLENGKMTLEEVHRFPNGMTMKNGELCWDYEALFREMKTGLKKCKEITKEEFNEKYLEYIEKFNKILMDL